MKECNTSDRLKEFMKEKGLKQTDIIALAKPFCEKYNIKLTKSDLSQYVNGITEPRQYKLFIIAKALDVNEAWLMGYDVPRSRKDNTETNPKKAISKYPELIPVETKKIPLLGEIACGKPIFTNEEYEVFVDAATDIQADFALKACGDSMINARINDGDIVFIREQPDVNNGEIAAVAIDDEVTLKRVYRQENSITLVAENPVYAPLVYTQQSAVTIHILGKAVAFQSNL